MLDVALAGAESTCGHAQMLRERWRWGTNLTGDSVAPRCCRGTVLVRRVLQLPRKSQYYGLYPAPQRRVQIYGVLTNSPARARPFSEAEDVIVHPPMTKNPD